MMPVWNESKKVRNSLGEQGQQNPINSERRRIELQSDLLTFQRDQRLSRAVRLQWRWQELSERERRAQQQNKQLLQEFERAQDTLRDMVARTAAMNTIRVEYEKYLDDNYPRWQQELKEKTLSAQRKRMEQHLGSIRRMEEKTVTGSPISAKAPLSQTQVPQTQNGQQDCSSHSFQSSWLTHARYQLASPHTMLSFNPKRTQVSYHTPESLHPPPHFHPFHPPQPFQYPHPSSIPIQPQTVTQQSSTMWPPQGEYPLDWAGRVPVFPSRTQFGYQSSMAGPSISDPQGWAVVEGVRVEEEIKEGNPVARIEGESSDGHRPRGNDQSHELDIKPVRLSSGHGESSECSRASGRASGESDSRTRRKKREQKEGRVKQSSADREETGLSSGRSVVGPDVEASASSASGAHSSEGDDATSGGGSTRSRRSTGPSAKQPKRRGEKAKSKGEETGSPVQESERHREESDSLGGESGSVSVKLIGCEEEVEETEEEQESLGVEGGTTGEEVMEEQNGDDEENSERVKEEGEEGEVDEESPRDEEEEGREELDEERQEGEEEVEQMHGENADEREDLSDGEKKQEAGEGAEDEKEEDEEASAGEEPVEEEEQSSQEAEELSKEVDHEEERESDDSIILPKEHRPAENRPILAEEEEGMIGDDNQGDDDHGEDARLEKGYSWSGDPTHAFQDEHDDIESLLAPQLETQKKLEKEQLAPNGKSKGMNITIIVVEI
ncbi:filaggrin-2-like [Osmerus eperlanus]|uniref:filaggrin-2-like n=1 Tax=Osmerus eperlanus TaxID=29151 RepID=UPI002E0DA679